MLRSNTTSAGKRRLGQLLGAWYEFSRLFQICLFFFFFFGAETILCYRYSANGKPQRHCRSVHDETSGCRWRFRAYWSDRPLLCNRARDARWPFSPVPLFSRDRKNSGQEIEYGEVMLFIKRIMITLCLTNRARRKMLNTPFFVKAEGIWKIFQRCDTMYKHSRKSMLEAPRAHWENGASLVLLDT